MKGLVKQKDKGSTPEPKPEHEQTRLSKRNKYIIAIVAATLIMVFDVGFCFSVNMFGTAGQPGNPQSASFEQRDLSSGTQPPSSEFESGSQASAEAPDSANESAGKNSTQGEGASGRSGRESGHRRSQSKGVALPIKVGAAAVFLLGLIVDGFSIVGLVRLGRKDSESTGDGNSPNDVPEDPVEARQRKQRRQRIAGGAALAVFVAAIATLQVMGGNNDKASSESIDERVVSANVELGDIQKTLSAFGTVASASEENLSVPGTIRVLNYSVSVGDAVSKGDIVATVDRNTVLAAIADIQDLIDSLDAEVTSIEEAASSDELTAAANGTVVKVYATAGEAVTDVMYENGALMLVSLDGLYGLKLDDVEALSIGDTVLVSGDDGVAYDGQVAAIEKESVTITMPLEYFSFGQTVTARDDSGTKLGSGELFVYNQQKITGYSGTVSSVNVAEGSSVSIGDTLLTLSGADYESDLQVLLDRRQKLVNQNTVLTTISKDGFVRAEEDGVIASLNEEIIVDSKSASQTQDTEDSTSTKQLATNTASATVTSGTGNTGTIPAVATAEGAGHMSSANAIATRAAIETTTTSTTPTQATNTTAATINTTMASTAVTVMPTAKTTTAIVSARKAGTAQTHVATLPQAAKKSLVNLESATSAKADGSSGGSGSTLQTQADRSAASSQNAATAQTDKSVAGSQGALSTQADGSSDSSQDADSSDSTESSDAPAASGSSESSTSTETVSKTASIIWISSDGSAMSQGMPDSVTVRLFANGQAISDVTVDEESDWSATFEVPKYDDEGNQIDYTIGLPSAVDGFTLSTSISASKTNLVLRENATADETEDTGTDSQTSSSSSSSASSAPASSASSRSNSSSSSGKNSAASSGASSGKASGSGPSSKSGASQKSSGAAAGGAGGGSDSASSSLLTSDGDTIADAETDAANTYTYGQTVLCTITPSNTVSIDVAVDELDVGNIVVGTPVQVTLDALSGQSFDGKISALDPSGVNSGGNTKYTVSVSLDKQENMLLGMNASVDINLEDLKNVPTIPEAALVEQDGKTLVYTSYDQAADELGSPVEVTCGVADGTNVQIASGLEEGQSYYYRYAETISYQFK